ncbi:MAG: DUF4397 domain-containing protein [Bacteroidales bacterium]|nr:DUF4397 domain-containing protein [Bacteroidales bacterium]
MKTTRIILSSMLTLMLLFSSATYAQGTARVQIIHNSADAAASMVDVWVNDSKFISDFGFRTATPFVDVPAGVNLAIAITAAGSTSASPAAFNADVTFAANETYVVVASGIVSSTGYNPAIPFGLSVYPMAREASAIATNTDVLAFHGSTDAPTVSIYETGQNYGMLAGNFEYGDFAGYYNLPVNDYILEVRDQTGTVTVASYSAPLSTLGLAGQSLTVLASGFLSPGSNNNGPLFGLYVALSTGGELIPLPVYTSAKVQIIHNSADAVASVVDVWADDVKLIENFEFRTSTPFVDVPGNVPVTISITGPGSVSPEPNVFQADVTFESGETYVVVANGIVSQSGYSTVEPFNLYVYDMGKRFAAFALNTDVLAFHGSTDAPTVSVWETGVGAGELFTFSYGDFAGYLELPTDNYIIEVRDETGTVTVAAYQAPLAALGLEGQALSVIASGFLNPANNSNGPAFGLFVALSAGGELVELPVYTPPTARLQVIHNSADAAAAVVDVWANEVKLIENFEFRKATPFIDVPAETAITISITGPGSTSPTPSVFEADVTFADGETYVVVANGIVSASGYSPDQAFNLYVYDMGREEANSMGNTDVLAFHGSTDAPTVSVWETGVGAGELFTFSYGAFAGYLELPTDNYIIEVRDETGTVTVASYQAPLAALGLEEQALSVIASGFLNPANNSNGPAFSLFVALAAGGDLVELPAYTQPTARLQVIHNSADAAAAVVDVWANDVKLLENFEFRTATPFIDVPAESAITISITGPGSTSSTPNVFEADVTFADGETYVVVANGIVSASGYSPDQPFNLYVYDMGREEAASMSNTDVLAFHGSTDAPTVSVWETGVGAGELFTFSYGGFAGYLELPTDNYIIEVRDETGTVTVAAYQAPLAALGLEAQALSVIASGFLNPANNSNGPAFGLFVALAAGGDLVELPAYTQPTARLQVIHNSADAAAAVVDVWLNDTKLIENFAFRTATPFIDAPADVEFTIAIQGPGSTSPENPIWSQNYTLAAGKTYILVAEGIVSPSGYNPSIPFDIAVYDMGREEGIYEYFVDVLIHHGATDAPTVDIYDTWQTNPIQLVNNISYSEFADYLSIINGYYLLEVRDESGTNTLATFEASLGSFLSSGDAATIIASGFLNPANNSNGPAFGLWVALAEGGDLIELPSIGNTSIARVQVIHNSADLAAAVVDVWLNDTKLIENFAFRTATPFIDAPAGEEFTIAIQAPGSTSPENPIWSQNYTLEADETYILVANGIVSASGYDPAEPFDIYVNAMGREEATSGSNTDVLAFHGSTDAPTVSVWETGVGAGELFTFSYGDFAGYLELPTDNYIIEVRDETGTVTVAAYQAPLAALGLDGAALSVVASGFLNPGQNSNGAAFGLFVALADGGELIELPLYTGPSARLQVIHNSADAAAAVVDVWANDVKLLENFEFRTATPFVDVPAETAITISITGPGSTSPTPNVFEADVTFADGETYVVVANGIVSASGYSPDQPFNLYVYDMGRETSTSASNTDVLVFHGSTDAPTVSIWETGVGAGELFTFSYGDFAGYLELPVNNYTIDVRDETGTVTVASYYTPLAGLGLSGEALTVLASGFLTPGQNSNGPSFGLYVALANGGDLIALPISDPLGVEEISGSEALTFFPNPAGEFVTLNMNLNNPGNVKIEMLDLLGKTINATDLGFQYSINNYRIDVSYVPKGIYFLKVEADNMNYIEKLIISR